MGELNKAAMVVCLCLLGVSAPLAAQDMTALWFPLAIGNHWTYEHSALDGSARSPHVVRWKTEETITGKLTIPEGTVVLRKVDVVGESTANWLSRFGSSHYLIHNSCLYFLDPSSSWNEQDRQLTADYRARLLNHQEVPAFCFPLVQGHKFPVDLHPAFTPSKVVGLGPGTGFTPASVSDKAYRVEMHLFDADRTAFWFEKGVGITGVWDWHNGHYGEYRVRLLEFRPAERVSADSQTSR